MKKTLTALMVAFTLLVTSGGVGSAQDFDKGDAAYRSGDYATALREFRPLAERGNAQAQYNLGYRYHIGQGVTHDNKEAWKWFRKSAEQGYAKAQAMLGVMYQYLAEDAKEAVKWYRKSAEQGHAEAQELLGQMYADGLGVTQDNIYAHMWLT